MLARALARSIGSSFKRVQCTPDLLPSDVTGASVFNQKTAEFEFRPGPVFTDVLLADAGPQLSQFLRGISRIPVPIAADALVISDNADIYGTLADLEDRAPGR